MLSSFRNRFGIPGVISVIALVFAMLGGAYAASNDSGSGKASASAKAKKGPRGPRGPAGPAGPAGPQGPAGAKGDNGAAGSNGKDGTNGTNGTNGTDGESVNVEAYVGPECPDTEEGVELSNGSGTAYACNGKAGEDGETGFTETLPPGKTETGSFYALVPPQATPAGSKSVIVPLPFAIPLASSLAASSVTLVGRGGTNAASGSGDLTGPSEAEPSGSKIVKNIAMGTGTFVAGGRISGAGIPANTTILNVISPTEIELSKAATASGTGVALTTAPPAQCDDGSAPPVSPEHPEADTGRLCVFLARAAVTNAGLITKPGAENKNTGGASTAGAKVLVFGPEAIEGEEIWGTFAVTG